MTVQSANTRKIIMISNTSVTAAATASGVVDTIGFDFVTIDVLVPTADDTAGEFSTCELLEGTVTNLSSGTTISGAVDGVDWTIPASVASGSQIFTFNVDTRYTERYISININPQTTMIVNVLATLFRAEQVPVGTTDTSIDAIINVTP